MTQKPVSYSKNASQRHVQKTREILRELPGVVTEFIFSLEDQTSALTRLAYVYDLRIFFDFLLRECPAFSGIGRAALDVGDIRKVTARDLQNFLGYLTLYTKDGDPEERVIENEAHGKMRKLSAVRSFFNYLFSNKYIDGNVASLIPLPKRHEKPIVRLEPNEVARLLDAAESGDAFNGRQHKYTAKSRVRDLALLTLLLGTGIRVSECVGLDMDDIDLDENAFVVTRKGGNEMILYFSDEVSEALSAYKAERKKIEPLEGHESAFFLSMQRRRITARAIENIVKKYARIAAPLKRTISPHKLRSTYATELYKNTGDIYLVADVLGHSDVNTTKRHYAQMSDEHRRKASKAVKLRED